MMSDLLTLMSKQREAVSESKSEQYVNDMVFDRSPSEELAFMNAPVMRAPANREEEKAMMEEEEDSEIEEGGQNQVSGEAGREEEEEQGDIEGPDESESSMSAGAVRGSFRDGEHYIVGDCDDDGVAYAEPIEDMSEEAIEVHKEPPHRQVTEEEMDSADFPDHVERRPPRERSPPLETYKGTT